MNVDFDVCLSFLFASEGGYVNDPDDPGGATNMGITRATLAAWRRIAPISALPIIAVQQLTKTEAEAIYRTEYWNAVQGDLLPAGLDYAVFDYGVMSGPHTAIKALQAVLGVSVDGLLGPITLAAAVMQPVTVTIGALCDHRLVALHGLTTWDRFATGWSSRVASVRTQAIKMARQSPATPLPSPASAKPAIAPIPAPSGTAAATTQKDSVMPSFLPTIVQWIVALLPGIPDDVNVVEAELKELASTDAGVVKLRAALDFGRTLIAKIEAVLPSA